jgi:hypothetical protein
VLLALLAVVSSPVLGGGEQVGTVRPAAIELSAPE